MAHVYNVYTERTIKPFTNVSELFTQIFTSLQTDKTPLSTHQVRLLKNKMFTKRPTSLLHAPSLHYPIYLNQNRMHNPLLTPFFLKCSFLMQVS